jgi:hypothetical protein
MSQEALNTVHGLWKAFRAGDMDAVGELLHPDIEWVIPDVLPWGGTYHGPSGVTAYLTNALEYLDVSASGAEFREFFHDGDKVIDIAMSYGRVKSTGKDFVMPTVHVTTVSDGKIVRMQSFYDPGNALRALEQPED